MALPRVKARLTSSAPAVNPQDLSAFAHVVGPCSAGPIGVPTQINGYTDLVQFGFGPGPEMVADILSVAGGPVYFTRTATTNAGVVVGTLTKLPAASGAPLDVFGAIVLLGADHDGDLLFQSIQEGVTLTLAVGMAEGYGVVGKDVTLTVTNASTANSIHALALGAAAPFLAQPIVVGSRVGTSVCGQVLAKTAFDPGTLLYTAKGAGCFSFAGADANGGVILLTQQTGVSAQIVVAGNNTPLSISRVGSKLVINSQTDGGGAVLSKASDVITAIVASADAAALGVTSQATGTGNGLIAAHAEQTLDPVRVAQVTPNAAGGTLGVVLAASTVTVTEATDANKNPTSTGALILAGITGDAAFVLGAALLGDGTGKGGPKAATALSFGSTGTAVLSGTPNDAYQLRVTFPRGGTVGTQPFPTIQWAVDYLAGTSTTPNYSGTTLVPANGIVQLKDGSLDTGLTITFTGTFAAGDLFLATTAAPTSGTTDTLAGIDAAIAESRFAWGFLTGPQSVSKAEATLIDGRCQAAFDAGTRQIYALFGERDLGEGAPGESVATYQASLEADYLGFVSARGRESIAAGSFLHISPYTLRQYRRPAIFAVATRKASIPCHENLGKVATGPVANCLFIFYDEAKTPGLHDQRFITMRTYPQRPGFYYFTGAPTMADPAAPNDAGYTLVERVGIANQLARIVSAISLNWLNEDQQTILNHGTNTVNGAMTFTGGTFYRNFANAKTYFGGGSFGTGPASVLNEGLLDGFGGISGLAVTNRANVLADDSLNRILALGNYVQESGLTSLNPGQVSGNLDIQGGLLSGTRTISGNVRNAASVLPGQPFGLLSISGNYTNSASGTYYLSINGAVAITNFPQTQVQGTSVLGGALYVNFTNGFSPVPGNLFTAMLFTARSGVFDTILNDTYGLEAFYTPTSLVLRAENLLPAVNLSVLGGNTQLVCNPFRLTASALDPDGVVTNLAVFMNGSPLATSSGNALNRQIESDFPAPVIFMARAIDDRGGVRWATQTAQLVTYPLHTLMLGGLRSNGFKICMLGQEGLNYSVLATTNLNLPFASWTNLGAMEKTNGIWRYLDIGGPTNQPRRFYRAGQM